MKRTCIATRSDGKPCKLPAIKGATVCHKHGGSIKHVKAKAAVRAELEHWGLGDTTVDPGETLLRLLSQSVARAERYANELHAVVNEHGLQTALVGDTLVVDQEGNVRKVGEYVRGLAELESRERDRAAGFAAKAVAAGLAERTVRIAEKQASIAERALLAALEDVGLTEQQQRQAAARLSHHLRATP